MGLFGDDIDLGMSDWYSSGGGGVLPDVSNSEPAQQPTTATGNGSGYYIDPSFSAGLFGSIQSALNYAIVRDQQNIAKNTGTVYAGTPLVASPTVAAQQANSRLVLLLLIGGGILLATRGK
jgi:hypothetical protein